MRNDQIKIGYGPTRYKGPKGLKRELDNLPQITQNDSDTFNELVTVSTYDPLSREGTGTTFDGDFINYINTSTSSLSPDDVIIVTFIDDEYYAIGISDRSGNITPVPLPAAAALSANFPIVTQPNLTFDLTAENVSSILTGYGVTHDIAGSFGIGTDTIIGKDGNTTVNAFTRSSSVNSSLFATALGVGFPRDIYIQQGNGTVILAAAVPSTNGTYNYRRPGDVVWSSFLATNGNDWNAFDHLTENMWTWSNTLASTGPSNFWRMSDTDTTPVDKGNLNVSPEIRTVTNKQLTSNVATLTTAADHQLLSGMQIQVAGVDATFNGTYTITGTPTSTTLTYIKTASNVLSTASGGTIDDTTVLSTYETILVAGHGYVAAIKRSSNVFFYLKNANDDSNFTLVATSTSAAFNPFVSGTRIDIRLTPNGDLTYIYKSAITTTWHMTLWEQSTSIVYDYDTNIPSTYTALTFTRDALQGHMHTSSGLVILQGIADDVTLGATTPGFYPATAAYNYISSTYIYYDPDLPDNISVIGRIRADIPIEIDLGVIRFMYHSNTNQNGAIPAQDRVYELTGV